MTRPGGLAVVWLVALIACRDSRPPRWRDEPRVPAGAADWALGCLPIGDVLAMRAAVEDSLARMVRDEWDDWSYRPDYQGIRYRFRSSLDSFRETLCEAPAAERLTELRRWLRNDAFGSIRSRAHSLAYRRLVLDHPGLEPVLEQVEQAAWILEDAPEIDRDEIETRVVALEVEFDAALARHMHYVTPYIECTEHVQDDVTAIRALFTNARGNFRRSTLDLAMLLRIIAPHVGGGGATLWDSGQSYGWPSCSHLHGAPRDADIP